MTVGDAELPLKMKHLCMALPRDSVVFAQHIEGAADAVSCCVQEVKW